MLYCENDLQSFSAEESRHVAVISRSPQTVEAVRNFFQQFARYRISCYEQIDIFTKNSHENPPYLVLFDYEECNPHQVSVLAASYRLVILCADHDLQLRETLFRKGILDFLVKDRHFEYALSTLVKTIETVERNEGRTLLVLHESSAFRQMAHTVLQARNYRVCHALSLQEARDFLDREMVNAIVLNAEFPAMKDFDFLREVKTRKEYCHIPVIVISSSPNPEMLRQALKTGASDFIRKPYTVEEFILKIDLAIEENRRYVDVLCSQKLLSEYKTAIDESTLVSKTDTKGIITYANEPFCKISGYSQKELVGSPHNIVRHPDMPAEVFKEMWRTIKAQKTWHGKIKNRKKNGEAYYVQSTIAPIVDYTGKTVEYIAIRTDITELEQYKEALEENLEVIDNDLFQLQQYEEAIHHFVAVIKTGTDGRILYLNDNFLRLSGYREEALRHQPCSAIRAPRHINNRECETIRKRLASEKTVHILFENRKPDGTPFFTDTRIHPIKNRNGEIVEHLHLMYDITDIIEVHKELEETQKDIIHRMAEISESRSNETGNHIKRVAHYSRLLAKLAGLDEKEQETLFAAAPMHDIGKVAIPDAILKKPDKLTDEEWEVMKRHTTIGYNVLKSSKRPILQAAAIVAKEHHEKFDGSGYPEGLKGEAIHIYARMVALADVFDALGSDRVYKKAWPLERVTKLIQSERGGHFDPRLVDLLLENLPLFLEIRNRYAEKTSRRQTEVDPQ